MHTRANKTASTASALIDFVCLVTTFPIISLFKQSQLLTPESEKQRGKAYARALDQVIRTSQQLQASVDNMGVPISLCGCFSNVVVWEKAHWDLIDRHIPVGTFLRLRNVMIPQEWQENQSRCEYWFQFLCFWNKCYDTCICLSWSSRATLYSFQWLRPFSSLILCPMPV